MTNEPISAQEPRNLDAASIDDLEKMLADAERNIHAIREELAERRAESRHEQIQALPDDISTFEGSWRSIIRILRDVIREERESRAAAKAED
ncbi:hypothetical protein ACFORJ_03255 [Corynebacterium hansenii]|uniref:Uncharacterized protein n=1 Tax=Corynebacterium hansenii TaxID=394964 RepID=A0ABV7ZKZ6_9CORY|nr:hypothetical protein [Corynebacterium hansenii]WJY98981.1 hypothetical protein CHAN_01750 [Corynebacterium hansenii]